MGANASTAVPLYASGQVLDAARLNLTNCGVPVFSGTASRDASFNGSGEKVLAEGQLCYLEDSNVVQYYDGASFATVGPATAGALTLISATTVGTAVASVTVTGAFSATYDHYKIVAVGGVLSGSGNLKLTLGSTATGYYSFVAKGTPAGSGTFVGDNNNSSFERAGNGDATDYMVSGYITDPFGTRRTKAEFSYTPPATAGDYGKVVGFLNNSTSYTAFTITFSGVGTLTGGTIYVYGYAKS